MRFSQIGVSLLIGLLFCPSYGQEKAGIKLWRAVGSMVEAKKQATAAAELAAEDAAPRMPQNSLSSPSNGITPTGKHLQPFGQPEYWGNAPKANVEEDIISLPPLPDLRTPDQVSKTEQKRNLRNAKYTLRHAENLAREEARKMALLAEINEVPQDPSTAMFQVQSQADSAPEAGRKELPNSAGGGKLKPFGESAAFVDGGQVKFRGGQGIPAEALMPDIEEESIIELPPLPDLRTPDQVSKLDQKRSMKNNKFGIRREKYAAQQAAIKSQALGELSMGTPDPSTALVQVQSKRDGAVDCGRRERPVSAHGGQLKPFNGSSTFVQGNELKYQWSDHKFEEKAGGQPTEDDLLAILPPLPDLRTPDQVTKGEKMRNLRLLKYRARQQRETAQRASNASPFPTLSPYPQ